MVALFQADIFSVASPRFSIASLAAVEQVRNVGEKCYPHALSRIETIEQFGGSEVNSNNFKLRSGSRQYLLKRLPARLDAALLQRQLGLMIWLRDECHVAVPQILLSSSDEVLANESGFHWCLFDFIDGNFFCGGINQLTATAYQIGLLQSALSRHPQTLMPPVRWQYLTDDHAETLKDVAANRKKWAEIFGPAVAAELSSGWEGVLRSEAELVENKMQVQTMVCNACHCDLHPHNILMAEDRPVAFIDFESFTWMPVPAALGFAAYKLIKQHAVSQAISASGHGQIARATEEFCEYLEQGGALGVDQHAMRLMAIAEIFRRMIVVLRLNLRERNTTWNHVLKMHLAGLEEIDLIFSPKSSARR